MTFRSETAKHFTRPAFHLDRSPPVSRFDDPQYMAESKAGIRSFIETGNPPPEWSKGRDRLVQAGPGNPYFRDWELRILCDAIRKAGHSANLAPHLPREFTRTPNAYSRRISAEGGRQAFLAKYVDL